MSMDEDISRAKLARAQRNPENIVPLIFSYTHWFFFEILDSKFRYAKCCSQKRFFTFQNSLFFISGTLFQELSQPGLMYPWIEQLSLRFLRLNILKKKRLPAYLAYKRIWPLLNISAQIWRWTSQTHFNGRISPNLHHRCHNTTIKTFSHNENAWWQMTRQSWMCNC